MILQSGKPIWEPGLISPQISRELVTKYEAGDARRTGSLAGLICYHDLIASQSSSP
jgi:hypothetical protein